MIDISSILVEVGLRLREQRERMNLSQADFGALAAVTRGSQAEYELGKRPFSASYIIAMRAQGVDVVYVLTGERSVGALSDEAAKIVAALDVMTPSDRDTLARLACSLAGQPIPPAPINLPSTSALEEAISAFLESSPGLQGDELVRELAMSLPTMLRGAADEIVARPSDRTGIPPVQSSAFGGDRHAVQQGQRT